LLVTVDTLRADALGAYGATGGLTPRLDALAQEALVFEAAYAPAPFTFPSIASILSGLHPGSLGIRTNLSQLPPDVPTLASALRERGFRTGAAVSSYVLRGKSGLADDFDVYDDVLLQREQTRDTPERTARDTTDAALAVLDRLREAPAQQAPRWLLWVHYQDPHGPYTPPPELVERARRLEPEAGRLALLESNHGGAGIPAYQALGEERDVADYRAAYRAEVAYTDAELGRLLDGLSARGLEGTTLVAFTADHGEALGEHDVYFAHGHDLTDELVRVPLLLRGPGIEAARRRDVVSLLDLYPTLLRQLGDAPPGKRPGRDLLAPGAEQTDSVPYLDTLSYGATRRSGLVAEGFKLILTWQDGAWRSRLFRRGHEDVDLSAPAATLAARLRSRLGELQQATLRGQRPEQRQELAPDERARLEALGYGVHAAP
jgi:arylsulfatase A-like enzyme